MDTVGGGIAHARFAVLAALIDTMETRMTALNLSLSRLRHEAVALDSINAFDAELGQSLNRLVVATAVIVFIAARWAFPLGEPMSGQQAMLLIFYYVIAFMLAACLLHLWIRKRPGHYPLRRILTMMLDYGSLAFTMSMGGEAMLPLFAIIMWVTMGNGLRYGRRYLLVAYAMAQTAIVVIAVSADYWRSHPNLILTMSLATLIVPAYAYSLLGRMEQARQEALAANTAKSRFLAQASHDLRQPVHAIGLFLASLRQTQLDKAQTVIVNRIDRSLQGVARLFRSLLDISTLDSGAVVPKIETVDLDELFQELVQQNGESAAWAQCDFTVMRTRAVVLADKALLTTIVQNLLSNAFKHAAGCRVLLGCRRRRGRLSIVVVDAGPGIAPEHIPHLCEEFYQVRKLGDPDKQGVGLGLAIVDRLTRLMDLRFSIRSRVGHGTMAAIDGLEIVVAQPRLRGVDARVDHRAPLKGLSVLLIEDDPDVLEATAELLESWGCVVQGISGMPGEVGAVDLVIADFDVGGGVTGADCIRACRVQLGPNLAAIIMTGHDEKRVASLVNDATIPVLNKPIRPAELRSLISAMRLRAARAA